MLSRLIRDLSNAGIKDMLISVNYLKEKIISYCGNGSKWGVNISYIKEDRPLGTAGSLGLVDKDLSGPIIVVNADVVTDFDFECLLDFHSSTDSVATLCTQDFVNTLPFGVVVLEDNGLNLLSFVEKPSHNYLVNAGIYCIDSSIIRLVDQDEYLDMPDLLLRARDLGYKVSVCHLHERWIDVGRPETLRLANS